MFALKYEADGTLDRHKARIVAKGFIQTYVVDYFETFSLFAKLNTVRGLVRRFTIKCMGIKSLWAYLMGF